MRIRLPSGALGPDLAVIKRLEFLALMICCWFRDWLMKALALMVVVLCGMMFLSGAQAQEPDDKALDAEIAAYVVPPQNRFVQTPLTKDMIERTLAILPDYLKLQTGYAEKLMAASRSDKGMWDKGVAVIAINKAQASDMDSLCQRGGFADRASYESALSSLVIVIKPEELRPAARLAMKTLKSFQDGGTSWLAGANIKSSFERMLSLAQQEPLPANLALITPMIDDIRKRIDAIKPER
jgi:hypothetical protein